MGGKATRKDVRIKFENAKGSAEMQILVFTPKGGGKPTPAFPAKKRRTARSSAWGAMCGKSSLMG